MIPSSTVVYDHLPVTIFLVILLPVRVCVLSPTGRRGRAYMSALTGFMEGPRITKFAAGGLRQLHCVLTLNA